ncbi:MAG: 16S rRNA (guanine(966)-N(2))-methyltransferase RsmD [Clostridia bacterium]|nr:16S rRNA (guanine(966)-N(2))-methyltransferase RsmD [Clostridia bacterium]
MRIISGICRGHKLAEFDTMDIRPTTDRVRESLFNLISDFVMDAKVLDLFGGSGALSLEALSRGALNSVICDIDQRAIKLINHNAESLRLCHKLKVLNKSAEQFLNENKNSFDIIFLDPPYNKGIIAPVIEKIIDTNALSEDGIIVLESDNTDEHGEFLGLSILKQRKYGRTYITVYKRG